MTTKEKLQELALIIHRFDELVDECLDYFDPASCVDETYDEIVQWTDNLRHQGLELINSLLLETEENS